MKIIITGGAGFIGSHVADAFIRAGHELIIVDNLSTGYLKNVNPQARFYNLDICDPALDQLFAEEKPDIVDHHAAQISVPLSVEEPLKDVQTNVLGLVNLLQCCVKHNVKKVIYISSGGAMYGEAEEYPTSETNIPKPLSVYAINKMVGEDYLHFYRHQYEYNTQSFAMQMFTAHVRFLMEKQEWCRCLSRSFSQASFQWFAAMTANRKEWLGTMYLWAIAYGQICLL
jgi:UDP-glucose 4-epimerase